MDQYKKRGHELLDGASYAPSFGPLSYRAAAVWVPIPVAIAYHYQIPAPVSSRLDSDIVAGNVVRVPLGRREVVGLVIAVDTVAVDQWHKLRPIIEVLPVPPLTAVFRRFLAFVANYTLTPPGLVGQMAVRTCQHLRHVPVAMGLCCRAGDLPAGLAMTSARARVLAMVGDGVWTKSGLAQAAGVSPSVLEGLKAAGVLLDAPLPVSAAVAPPQADFQEPHLEQQQKVVADQLKEAVHKKVFTCFLLNGVTGSGKTEVYFEAVAQALREGRQVLILLPEIALTEQFITRFSQRFGAPPAAWHSDLATRTRARIWEQVALGQIRVVAGARSALFLPFQDLGLIVVDEEHDSAYKQEERVFYNARDMAVARASFGGAPVVLASATPSLESRVNVLLGRYRGLYLTNRFKAVALPTLQAIDMRKHAPKAGKFISPPLQRAMAACLKRGEQSLLFLNRRGYAPLTLCRVCGHRFQCPNCVGFLVEHRQRQQLLCHHCGYHQPVPDFCPQCGTMDHLVACGPGVERIAEEVQGLFPLGRLLVLSVDKGTGVKGLRQELASVASGEVDIIIGTQLVAKGHDFPLISLVGVVDADLGLAHGDPRAAERTLQLLAQVTGRAGRHGLVSEGLIQTYQPEHPVLKAIISGDQELFYQREMSERARYQLPPYGRMAALIISAEQREVAETYATAVRRAAPSHPDITLLGPAEAPLALLRGRYRFRLLIQAPRAVDIQSFIRTLLAGAPKKGTGVSVQVDIDPQSFL
ncbi:primosomal protein N' [Bartonella sp. DGB2]|uniref:primosomal protein N' n=1 Tax=Bartonella sp. DGB2 TaxID=3388426 RepID=UPI00398F953A